MRRRIQKEEKDQNEGKKRRFNLAEMTHINPCTISMHHHMGKDRFYILNWAGSACASSCACARARLSVGVFVFLCVCVCLCVGVCVCVYLSVCLSFCESLSLLLSYMT